MRNFFSFTLVFFCSDDSMLEFFTTAQTHRCMSRLSTNPIHSYRLFYKCMFSVLLFFFESLGSFSLSCFSDPGDSGMSSSMASSDSQAYNVHASSLQCDFELFISYFCSVWCVYFTHMCVDGLRKRSEPVINNTVDLRLDQQLCAHSCLQLPGSKFTSGQWDRIRQRQVSGEIQLQ